MTITLDGVPAWALPRIRDNPRPRWLREAETALVLGRLRVMSARDAEAEGSMVWAAQTDDTLFVWRETRPCSWELVAVALSG